MSHAIKIERTGCYWLKVHIEPFCTHPLTCLNKIKKRWIITVLMYVFVLCFFSSVFNYQQLPIQHHLEESSVSNIKRLLQDFWGNQVLWFLNIYHFKVFLLIF